MTTILGISAFFHDSAAALVVDGEIIAAVQEERLSRVKHDPSFPQRAIEECLKIAGLKKDAIDYVGFYEKPILKFSRLLETYLAFAPRGYRSFRQAIPSWILSKLHTGKAARAVLPNYRKRLIYLEHHQSHAASAFYPSPFEEAAILTMDGVGEWSSSCIGYGQGRTISLTKEMRFPHSLGLLYSAFTYHTGFQINDGEYKLMGLAPYGQPTYREAILEKLVDLKEDGSLWMDMRYFQYCHGLTMTNQRFDRLFGGPRRVPESPITQREMDLAASVQSVTEEVMLRSARYAHQQTGSKNLVMAGGVALNCVGNGRILREGPFERIWIQPAASDSGGALGVALAIWHQVLGKPREPLATDAQKGSLLGPAYDDASIREFLDREKIPYRTWEWGPLLEEVSQRLASQEVVGWFQGRMEFGPRALGARSILADARSPEMQQVLNQKIKFRESFRPFAPIVLDEYANDYFCLPQCDASPYMLIVSPIRESKRKPVVPEAGAVGWNRLREVRSELPAITHVDYSARVQTVSSERSPQLHALLTAFHRTTGTPVLVNTSLNVMGEPIACTPQDAYHCFQESNMDSLVLGRQLLTKRDKRASP